MTGLQTAVICYLAVGATLTGVGVMLKAAGKVDSDIGPLAIVMSTLLWPAVFWLALRKEDPPDDPPAHA